MFSQNKTICVITTMIHIDDTIAEEELIIFYAWKVCAKLIFVNLVVIKTTFHQNLVVKERTTKNFHLHLIHVTDTCAFVHSDQTNN